MTARPLQDLAEIIFSGRFPPTANQGRPERLLALRDVEIQLAPVDQLEVVTVPVDVDLDRLRLKESDVVVTSRTARVRAAVTEPSHAGVLVGPNLIVVRTVAVSPHLIAAYLRHPSVQHGLLAEFASRNPPGFTVAALGRLPLNVPESSRGLMLAELAETAEAFAAAAEEAARLRRAAAYDVIFQELSRA